MIVITLTHGSWHPESKTLVGRQGDRSPPVQLPSPGGGCTARTPARRSSRATCRGSHNATLAPPTAPPTTTGGGSTFEFAATYTQLHVLVECTTASSLQCNADSAHQYLYVAHRAPVCCNMHRPTACKHLVCCASFPTHRRLTILLRNVHNVLHSARHALAS